MLVLRIGMPIACVGLMDSDKGVFGGYIKKFFQSAFTILVQITLLKMSIALMLNMHVLWAIAGMSLAMKTPRFLQEFMIMSGGGTNMSSIYHTGKMVNSGVNIIKKIAAK